VAGISESVATDDEVNVDIEVAANILVEESKIVVYSSETVDDCPESAIVVVAITSVSMDEEATREQRVPFPLNPALHSQEYEPTLFEHVALESHKCLPVLHSSTSVQTVPFPPYPLLHWHEYEPRLFEHVALESHEYLPVVHSSISVQVVPFPLNPLLHSQEYEPTLFEHVALE